MRASWLEGTPPPCKPHPYNFFSTRPLVSNFQPLLEHLNYPSNKGLVPYLLGLECWQEFMASQHATELFSSNPDRSKLVEMFMRSGWDAMASYLDHFEGLVDEHVPHMSTFDEDRSISIPQRVPEKCYLCKRQANFPSNRWWHTSEAARHNKGTAGRCQCKQCQACKGNGATNMPGGCWCEVCARLRGVSQDV